LGTLLGIFFVVIGLCGIAGTYLLTRIWDEVRAEYQRMEESPSAVTRWSAWRPWPASSQLILGWSISLVAVIGGLAMLFN
jgi:hypothetical protein